MYFADLTKFNMSNILNEFINFLDVLNICKN